MQSSRPFQTDEDNLEEERGGSVPSMFIESCARQRQRKGEDREWSDGIKRHRATGGGGAKIESKWRKK